MKIFIGILTLIVLLGAVMAFQFVKTPQIGYVHTQEIISGYEGMIEAQKTYEQFSAKLTENADTLFSRYQRNLSLLNISSHEWRQYQVDSLHVELERQRENIFKYNEIIEERKSTEEKLMMEGVLNQINASIFSYGEEKGYDIILGTGQSGNLLYGNDNLDLTEEILIKLNNEYFKKHDE